MQVLVGHPDYEVTGGSVVFKGENLLEMEPFFPMMAWTSPWLMVRLTPWRMSTLDSTILALKSLTWRRGVAALATQTGFGDRRRGLTVGEGWVGRDNAIAALIRRKSLFFCYDCFQCFCFRSTHSSHFIFFK